MVELSSAAAAGASSSVSVVRLPVPPNRHVARPITNLGNTCYMNAVLQALAHAPELCLAMDCDPHHIHCPVAQENRRRRQTASPVSSPEHSHNNNAAVGSSSSSNNANAMMTTMMENDFRRKPARKLRRSSRKSPTNGISANNTNNTNGEGSPGHDNSSNNNRNAIIDAADDGGQIYCALCEMEFHLQEVHSPAAAANGTNNVSTKEPAVEPEMFATGFIQHVAPHFKMGNQEDSHEFLRLLIDAMQHSAKNARHAKKNSKKRHRASASHDKEDHRDDEDATATRMDIDASASTSSPSTRSTRRTSLTVQTQTNQHDSPNHSKTSPSSKTSSPSSKTSHNKNSNSSTSEEDTEYPFQLFRGTVESCVTCDSCKATSSTLDPIEDVGLEVTPPSPGSSSSWSHPSTATEALADVGSAFRRFARVEDLDSGYKCESCGKGGRATKQSRLASIPPILTLHLKRFRYGGDARGPSQAASMGGSNSRRTTKSGSAKIEGHIKFEQIFDLKPYLTDELQAKQKAMFCRLFAVVVHAGKNSHSGHYIAYVRNIQKNEWWKMDDARITKVDMQEVMQAEAYMLFYRVVEHPFALHLKEKTKILQEEREALAKKERLAAEAQAAAAAAVAVEVDTKKETDEAVAEKENVPTPSNSPKEGNAGAESSETAPDSTKSKATPDKSTKQGPSTRSATKAASAASPSTSSNGKKRTLPDYLDGKSWAKKNTRLKPEHYNSIRSAEEYVNENVQLKPEFFKLITEEGSKEDAKVGKCSINMISGM